MSAGNNQQAAPPLRLCARALLLLIFLLPSAAFADGKVLPKVGFLRTETPEQRALIHWAEGVETLVVETSARTDSTNLAWIIPLPAKPTEIRPASPAIFSTLQTTFQPRIEMTGGGNWGWFVFFAALALVSRWQRSGRLARVPLRLLDVFLVIAVLLVLASMLLPSLATASAKGALTSSALKSSVRLLGHERAGVYDLTTLTAKRADDLTAWLRTNGFAAPAEITPVVTHYLTNGWVFVAAKSDRISPSNSLTTLHPLAFTFPVNRAVYPMRLTGVDATNLVCDLYVFGPGRAAARNWTTAYCARPEYDQRQTSIYRRVGLRIRQAELAGLAQHAPVATKLTARFSTPAEFEHDVDLDWQPYRPIGQLAYPRSVVARKGFDLGCLVLCLGWFAAALRRPVPRMPPPWFERLDAVVLGLALLAGLSPFLFLTHYPKEAIGEARRFPGFAGKDSALQLTFEAMDLRNSPNPPQYPEDLQRFRGTFAEFLRTNRYEQARDYQARAFTNVFTSERVRLEASPGNVTLEQLDDDLVLVWHDFDGAPTLTNSILLRPPKPGR